MGRATTTSSALARIDRLCAADLDTRELRAEVLEQLRRLVPFDAHVWVLTDPRTCVGADPLADVPCLPELPRLVRLKYLTPLHRWTALRQGQVALLDRDTGGQPARSLVWQQLLSSYDVRDVASCAFRDRFGCWAFLDLWRTAPHDPFTTAEAGLLASVTGSVTTALRRAQARTFGVASPAPAREPGAAVLLLGPGLEVRAQTPETERYLAALLPPAAGGAPVPAAAYNAGAQLLAREAGVDDHEPATRVHLAGGRWLTLRAARLGEGASADVAVALEETSGEERLGLFAAAFGLTPRETEVLGHVAAGRDTREAAQALVVSEHTVHDHLKAVFAKTRTRTRGSLLATALGASAGGSARL